MAMTVNVYEERSFLQEFGERTTPNLRLAEAGIKDSKNRTMGHNASPLGGKGRKQPTAHHTVCRRQSRCQSRAKLEGKCKPKLEAHHSVS